MWLSSITPGKSHPWDAWEMAPERPGLGHFSQMQFRRCFAAPETELGMDGFCPKPFAAVGGRGERSSPGERWDLGLGSHRSQSHIPKAPKLLSAPGSIQHHRKIFCPSLSGNQGICSCLKPCPAGILLGHLQALFVLVWKCCRCVSSPDQQRVQPIKLLCKHHLLPFTSKGFCVSQVSSAQLSCHIRERNPWRNRRKPLNLPKK